MSFVLAEPAKARPRLMLFGGGDAVWRFDDFILDEIGHDARDLLMFVE